MLTCSNWADRVVPLAMEAVPLKPDLRHLLIGDGHTTWVPLPIDLGPDAQAGPAARRADLAHYGRQIYQRDSAPVHGNVREEPMLNLVPFAGAEREVTDGDGQTGPVREALEFPLPQAQPRAIATTGVGCDQQGPRVQIADRPIRCHQRRIAFTANLAVSRSMPTLTHPSFRRRS